MSNDLTYYERQVLQYWLRTKMSLRKIEILMKRDHSILSKEINRNGSNRNRYRADTAQAAYERRKHQQRLGKIDKYPQLREFIEKKLSLDWSPEQIAGRLKSRPPLKPKGVTISHESIYYYIYQKSEKYKKLYKHLRTHRNKRKPQGKRKTKNLPLPQRKSIHERPMIIDQKERFGDWESDTVEFVRKSQNPYLSVQYERKSQLVRINKMTNKTAEETKEALIKTAESLPDKELLKTITFDNGTENYQHTKIAELYDIKTYFCDPFCSWQKGGVENVNKLIRQYLPKKTNINELDEENLYAIQERLNNRPRKSLNYLSPNEVIKKVVRT